MRLIIALRRRILTLVDAGVSNSEIVARARTAVRHVARSYPPLKRCRLFTALELAIITTLPARWPLRLLAAVCLMALVLTGFTAMLIDSKTGAFEQTLLPNRPLVMNPAGRLAWQRYKERFIDPSGRVIDTGNGNISHSEGQGYAMVLAVAADDRQAFERVWQWTQTHLMVRQDGLLSWRWSPGSTPPVTDPNNASDGDILVAWALAEAGSRWKQPGYTRASRTHAIAIGKRLLVVTDGRHLLAPGAAGFSAKERSDGQVVNLSYWVFPGLLRLREVAPEVPWSKLFQTGLDLLSEAEFGPHKLPPDWLAITTAGLKPAKGFATVFSYDAARIPLYLIWAGQDDHILLRRLAKLWTRPEAFATIELSTGIPLWRFGGPDYFRLRDWLML